MTFNKVQADPYAWPYDGPVDPARTAVLCIDWQIDFCGAGGYVDAMVFTGITTDVCVHTIMREANDLGYECLLLEDCTGATDYGNYQVALKMVKMQGGVFGSVATSAQFLAALDGPS